MFARKLLLRIVLILVFALILPFGAAHGRPGWVSSGGELFRFDKNPWFVKNLTIANYCVLIDLDGLSFSKAKALEAIDSALTYWKTELRSAKGKGRGFAQLATQSFQYQATCDSNTDIKFKFGYGSLTLEEVEYLKDPKKYIGVAVRTSDYDKVQMRASGFIFIASDRGENAYHNAGHLIEKAWQHANLLKYALIHELGHVFGLPHGGTGIMSEVFMDQLLHKRFSRQFYMTGPLKSFLHPPSEFTICTLNGQFDLDYFGLNSSVVCLSLVEAPGKNKEYAISSLDKPDGSPEYIGKLRFVKANRKSNSSQPASLIHLPIEQEVFTRKERFLNTFMIGPLSTDIGGKAVYIPDGKFKPQHLYMEMKPDAITLVATVDGKPKTVLVYSSPTLIKLLLPF